jgi:hypothetical protein
MGNFEKPLTWVLAIVLLGYLFVANCDCGDGTTCPLNSAFNIENSAKNAAVLESNETEEVTGGFNIESSAKNGAVLGSDEIEEVAIEEEDTTIIIEVNIDSSGVVLDDVEEDISE